jgi:hypothetical protein
MLRDLDVAFRAAVELMAMSKAELIERRAWDAPVPAETLAIATKTAEVVSQVLNAAAARVTCAMTEFADA